MTQLDVLIIGGGLVGISATLALQKMGFRCLCIEQNPIEQILEKARDRSLAVSFATAKWFHSLGIWDSLKHSSDFSILKTVNVWFSGTSSQLSLTAADIGHDALGYILRTSSFLKTLYDNVQPHCLIQGKCLTDRLENHWSVQVGSKRYEAPLLILAGGVQPSSELFLGPRLKTLGASALVANVRCIEGNEENSFECFSPEGVIACLPFGPKKATIVWSGSEESIQSLSQLSDSAFLKKWIHYSYGRFPKPLELFQRSIVPLSMSSIERQAGKRLLLLGNSAHLLHPIAAQGFNLAIRSLKRALFLLDNARALSQDLGAPVLLQAYVRSVAPEQEAVLAWTRFLVEKATDACIPLGLKSQTIRLLNGCNGLRRRIAGMGSGLWI